MQPTNPRTAWLAGASGLVGGFVLQGLLGSEIYSQVVALGRRKLQFEHPKLRQIVVDFGQLSMLDLSPATDVFCALGTTIKKAGSRAAFRQVDVEYPIALAKKGAGAGAAQFLLVSSVGASAMSRNFYLRTKGELEDALFLLPFSGVHIFRPSMLLGLRQENRPAERLAAPITRLLAPLMIGSLQKYRAIEARDVAAAMLAAAREQRPGKFVYEYQAIRELASK